jgi:hypothetical protein
MSANQPAPPLPRCPHCGEDLAGMGLFMWQIQGWLIVSAYCPNLECRSVLQTQMLPLPGEKPMIDAEPRRVVTPS